MPYWKVRPRAKFSHAGQDVKPGTVLELPRRLASEFSYALDECDKDGVLLPANAPAWQVALETIQPHETVDVLRMERAKQAATVADLQEQTETATANADALFEQWTLAQVELEKLDKSLAQAIDDAAKAQADQLAAEAAAASEPE